MIKRIFAFIIMAVIFTVTVSAEELNNEEFYRNQYELSGADELSDYLPDETKDFLYENGIDPENSGWVNSLTAENVFKHIINFFKTESYHMTLYFNCL